MNNLKDYNMVKHDLDLFQNFSNSYGDTINDIETAEIFFVDFMKQTKGCVIVDFLDTANWDCIRKVEVDKQNGLIWFYWQIPSDDPVEEEIRKMVFPLGYYGMCMKFDNVRFVKEKGNRCIGIIVNGYTIRERSVIRFAQNGGWNAKIDNASSFFSMNVVREKDGVCQHWRFMKTPISSFWIIPKCLNVHPQDSEKLLYMSGVEKCKKELNIALDKTKELDKLGKEEQRRVIKTAGHDIRTVAESLFKLVMCFYHEECQHDKKDYDKWMIGKLTGPLKKDVYKQDHEQKMFEYIYRITNDLSHDSGNPVDLKDLYILFKYIFYFVNDFKFRIMEKGNKFRTTHSDKPSPDDFVKANYKSFCFIDEINETVHRTNGKISFKIKAQIGTFITLDLFLENGEEVLCSDGYIRNTKEAGIDILKVWDRGEVVALLDKMHQKVTAICENNEYDTEADSLGISFEAKLKKESTPSHLFTEKEIEVLMRNADDEVDNKLVIDEDGYAHTIQDPQQGHLYPVAKETWCAGNVYVGKNSKLSDLHDSYLLCMHLWLDYLKTGQHMYSDLYVPDNELKNVIEEVKKFYKNGNE